MVLEERYIVIKLKNLHEEGEEYIRNNYGPCLVDCLVIESDWPEYRPALELLSKRVDNEQP